MSAKHEEEARLRILKGALKIFAEKGFYEATTRQIAGEADVNIASLNYYFRSKNGLLVAVMEEFVAPQVRDSASLLMIVPDSRLGVTEQLEKFLHQLLENYFENTEIFHLYLRVLDSNDAVLKGILPLVDAVFKSVHTFLQKGKDKGIILTEGESDIAAIMILTSFVGLVKNELSRGRVYPVSLKDTRFVDKFFKQMIAKTII